MDGQIIAAIIAGVAAVVAATIAIIPKIRKPKKKDKLAAGFQFGYYAMELYYSIKFRYEAENIVKSQDFIALQELLINESKAKCQNLAKQLAINFSASNLQYNKDVLDQLPYISEIETAIVALPMQVRYSINSGRRLSAVFHRDYQFHFLKFYGFQFTKEQIDFVSNEFDDEIKTAIEEFKKTNVNKRILNDLTNYINSLRTASNLSKEDWADSFSKIRKLVEDVALKINQ